MLDIILIIVAAIVLVGYSLFATIGMIKGMKKAELYEEVFKNIKLNANKAYEEMKDVDTLGAFEADDDVGAAFDEIKSIVDELNNYINTENIDE